jgi:hypothetical protein
MTAFTESAVKQAALAWLERLGWRVTHGLDIAPSEAGARLFRPARRPHMCALWQRPVSESGRLCHGDGGHEGGARRRRGLMLPCMKPAGRVKSPLDPSLWN